MCVVPASDSVARALEVELFQQLLPLLGLQPPNTQVRGGGEGEGVRGDAPQAMHCNFPPLAGDVLAHPFNSIPRPAQRCC